MFFFWNRWIIVGLKCIIFWIGVILGFVINDLNIEVKIGVYFCEEFLCWVCLFLIV